MKLAKSKKKKRGENVDENLKQNQSSDSTINDEKHNPPTPDASAKLGFGLDIKVIEYLTKLAENNKAVIDNYKNDFGTYIKHWAYLLTGFAFIVGFWGIYKIQDIYTVIENQKIIMTNKIKDKLSSENVDDLIEEYVTNLTSSEISVKFSKEIDKKTKRLEKEISKIKDKIMEFEVKLSKKEEESAQIFKEYKNTLLAMKTEAQTATDKLSEYINVKQFGEMAINGSYKDYIALNEVFNTTTGEVHAIAETELQKIESELKDFAIINDATSLEGLSLKSGEVYLPLDQFNLSTIIDAMRFMTKNQIKRCIKYIIRKNPKEVYQSAINVFENSQSLYIRVAFGVALSELHKIEAKKQLNYTKFDELILISKLKLSKILVAEKLQKEIIVKQLMSPIRALYFNPLLKLDEEWLENYQKLMLQYNK